MTQSHPLAFAGSEKSYLGQLNPLRYRGYVYDQECSLYYLQSRYYSYDYFRFISPDAFASTGQGFTGNNMFAYCGNNPVDRCDAGGTRYCEATSISKEGSWARGYSCYWQRQVVLEKYNPEPIGSYSGGSVYLVTAADKMYSEFPGDVVIYDFRGPGLNDGVKIKNSFLITNDSQQREILTLLYNFEQANPTGWNRTVDSMLIEWAAHNDSHAILTWTPLKALTKRAAHVYFNNCEEDWTSWDHTWGRFLSGK